MRVHRVFPALQPWSWRTDALRELARAEHLAALRIEPVTRGREPAVLADLHFCSGERSVTIPMVYVDLAQLELRETDPLVFPHAVLGVLGDAHAGAIVERVFPDLERCCAQRRILARRRLSLRRHGVVRACARARILRRRAARRCAAAHCGGRVRAPVRVQEKRDRLRFRKRSSAPRFSATSPRRSWFRGAGADADARAWYGDFAEPGPAAPFDLAVGAGPAPVPAGRVVRTDAKRRRRARAHRGSAAGRRDAGVRAGRRRGGGVRRERSAGSRSSARCRTSTSG